MTELELPRDTETIDKLFLELSQFTQARTRREIKSMAALEVVRRAILAVQPDAETYYSEDNWNPDAHVELTFTVGDIRAVFHALREPTP
jgi:hypothetical protein